MTADELGSRVNHDVCSVLDRADEVWGAEGVIDNQWDVVAMSNLSQLIDIGYIRVRISKGLCIECLGIVLDGSLYLLEVARIHDGVADTLCG